MAEREVVSLVWHRRDLRIVVSYAEGYREHWIGSDVVAAVLAADAGLSLVSTSDGRVRWVRDPDSCTATRLAPRRRYPALPVRRQGPRTAHV